MRFWRALNEQIGLAISFLDAPAGYVKIVRVQFDADAFAAELGAGNKGGAAAHERI